VICHLTALLGESVALDLPFRGRGPCVLTHRPAGVHPFALSLRRVLLLTTPLKRLGESRDYLRELGVIVPRRQAREYDVPRVGRLVGK